MNTHENYTYNMWRPPSLSELTPMVFNEGLTHLDSEASICKYYIATIRAKLHSCV